MISKNEIKLIRSLRTKKFRDKHNLFVAEGEKIVAHFIQHGWLIHKLFCAANSALSREANATVVLAEELNAVTHLDSPNTVLAVFYKKENQPLKNSNKILMLDDVRDPGNLGTIIRLADWFGIKQVVCSSHTVDLYNTKTVHSTMGSLANVSVVYTDLVSAIAQFKDQGYTIAGTLLNGQNAQHFTWPKKHVLVLGNEANGISEDVIALLDVALTFPKAPSATAESLNVAMAAAVFLALG